MNGYLVSGITKCYKHPYYPDYMLWVQRLHLFLYSVVPSIVLFIFNTLLMRTIFASKRRLDKHRRLVIFAATTTSTLPISRRKVLFSLQHFSSSTFKRAANNTPSKLLNRHSRKLTISLIIVTISYFTLTFPSTVIFSFFRSYIHPPALRRTISLLFTNLSTTTHAIRFFIYFFCSIDFRSDFYKLFLFKRLYRTSTSKSPTQQYQTTINISDRQIETLLIKNKVELD